MSAARSDATPSPGDIRTGCHFTATDMRRNAATRQRIINTQPCTRCCPGLRANVSAVAFSSGVRLGLQIPTECHHVWHRTYAFKRSFQRGENQHHPLTFHPPGLHSSATLSHSPPPRPYTYLIIPQLPCKESFSRFLQTNNQTPPTKQCSVPSTHPSIFCTRWSYLVSWGTGACPGV